MYTVLNVSRGKEFMGLQWYCIYWEKGYRSKQWM